ncbi:DUF2304 domain-containing protein [Cryptosporangium aurantiacum]|uniref:DUF2304 domain-containing protein n=1 Tax=Cryptosporangium aurantiacum TaxID=134849 RepID=A0A1M7RIF1_9ACTN|nr:DUF2304 domain-containing protein [Cryptosporangium aurantiacum]SHN46095.1 hypothetical protein SAMN05443668_113179 [Cryptosporangium aurantiacum]
MVIQFLLLLAVAASLVYFVRQQHGVRLQAGKRLAFVAFLLFAAYAVIRPDDLTWVAHKVGVGRGADLVLYATVVAFVFVVINFYLRTREMERRITELARAVALRDAEILNQHRIPTAPSARPDAEAAMLAAVVAEGKQP